VITSICAGGIVSWYSYIYLKACGDNVEKYYDDYDRFEVEIYDKIIRGTWIMFAILALIFFAVGWLMLNRLKRYYKDFYREFGC